jgi:hypothetical protein
MKPLYSRPTFERSFLTEHCLGVYFVLNEDRNKYFSVEFYTQQGYSFLVELGAAKSAFLRLTEH